MLALRTRYATALAALFICAFYAVTAFPSWRELTDPHDPQYHDHLAKAFLVGQTHLQALPDERIQYAADPWDPDQNVRARMHDMSYYNGAYYLYWGPVPAALFYTPYRLLTGTNLPDRWVVFASSVLGFLFLFAAFRRALDYIAPIPSQRTATVTLSVLGALYLGLGNGAYIVLGRPIHYEVAVACGMLFISMATFFLIRSLHQSGRRLLGSLALGSLCFGLAVGCRATLIGFLPAAAFMLALHWRRPGGSSLSWPAQVAACLALPAGLIGAGLMAYNFVRFDHVLEFGVQYQLNDDNMRTYTLFSPARALDNIRKYYLNTVAWSASAPFWRLDGYDGKNIGILQLFPLSLLVALLPVLAGSVALLGAEARLRVERCRTAGMLLRALRAAAVPVIGFLSICAIDLMAPSEPRYSVDFSGLLLLAALIVLAAALTALRGRRMASLLARAALWLVAVVGTVVQVWIFSTYHDSPIAQAYPRTLGLVAGWVSKISGETDALIIEAAVDFVAWRPGNDAPAEPLIVVGAHGEADTLFVERKAKDLIVLGYDHWGTPAVVSAPIRIDPSLPHRLIFSLDRRQNRVEVALDGRETLSAPTRPYPIQSGVALGRSTIGSGILAPSFSGAIRLISKTGIDHTPGN